MGLRSFTFDSSATLAFITGSEGVGGEPVPPSTLPGAQPPSEKLMGFCPIQGLLATYAGPSIAEFSKPVNEYDQSLISGDPSDDNTAQTTG
jgi:hypothetical protein